MSEINERLKQLRLESGLSQSEFASQLGISKELISQMERGVKNVSPATANSLKEIITEANIPTSFLEAYKRGQRFGKIVDVLIKRKGYTLKQLRNKDFNVKGSELTLMYIGITPVPADIRKTLEEKYQVNLEFILRGNNVPMFRNSNIEDSEIEFPYFTNQTIQESLENYKSSNFENSLKISIPKINVDFFVDIFGDNVFPTFRGREVVGVKLMPVENLNFGSLYLMEFSNGECQLRRIFQHLNNKKVVLKKEDNSFPEVVIDIKSIRTLFAVKTVITKDFYY